MQKVVLNKCFGGYSLSKEACDFLGLKFPEYGYGYHYYNDRTNPRLVECVETLGEKANGGCADLEIEEYDDYNYDYYISEYDGAESLHLEPKVHKTKLQSMRTNEIVEYLTSLGITVVE